MVVYLIHSDWCYCLLYRFSYEGKRLFPSTKPKAHYPYSNVKMSQNECLLLNLFRSIFFGKGLLMRLCHVHDRTLYSVFLADTEFRRISDKIRIFHLKKYETSILKNIEASKFSQSAVSYCLVVIQQKQFSLFAVYIYILPKWNFNKLKVVLQITQKSPIKWIVTKIWFKLFFNCIQTASIYKKLTLTLIQELSFAPAIIGSEDGDQNRWVMLHNETIKAWKKILSGFSLYRASGFVQI